MSSSISFSGLASGLDTSSWVEALVSVKQEKVTSLQTELAALQTKQNTLTSTQTTFTSLRSALEKFTDSKFTGTFDLFSKNNITTSDSDIFTATVDYTASRQSYDVVVEQLATYTKATSGEVASKVADDNTKLSDIGIKEGKLSIYVDGVKTTINIEKDDKLSDLKSQLATAGVKTVVDDDGVVTLSTYDEGKTLDVGSTTDTGNFISLLGLVKQEGEEKYVSTNSMYQASTASVLTSENAGFTTQINAGTFIIGDTTFTIDENTTLSSLISTINNNKEAQAYAYWDDAAGKLSITSTKEGASYINIEAGTSNFTDVMGLTTSEWDDDGNLVSTKMLINTQELGQNAKLTINGTEIVSTSNTVSSDVSRIAGVTINLKSVGTQDDGTLKRSTMTVEQNTDDIVSAAQTFIDAYNAVIEKIDEVTASGADLAHESSLTSFKNTIRSYASGSNTANGGAYKLLSQIGISTGEADSTNISTDCNTLELDEDALIKALQEDPDSVKSILAGSEGILSQMESSVEQMLQSTTGFFDVKSTTFKSEISKMEDKISTQQDKVNTYQTQLENKFYQMELTISTMQQNYSSFLTSSS